MRKASEALRLDFDCSHACSPPARPSPRSRAARCACIIWDSPPSASIHEEATVSTVMPFMARLQQPRALRSAQEAQHHADTIRPELATSWAWNDDKTKLTFKLRDDVKWHDGKPFTAKDVVCTLDKLQDKGSGRFPQEPAQDLVAQPEGGDGQRRPRGDVPPRAAAGVVPRRCSPPATTRSIPATCRRPQMRTKPIGTGPFKFVEFKSNESVKLVRNPDYWRKGHPYLDAIDWRVISNRSTRVLAFVAGEFDMTFSLDLTVAHHEGHPVAAAEGHLRAAADQQLLQPDRQPRDPAVQRCQDPLGPGAGARPQGLRRHHHRRQGQDRRRHAGRRRKAAGACRRRWWRRLPGYGTDVEKNRAEARKIMEGLGYGPEQSAQGEGGDAQHPALSRSGRDPDRPAQADPRRGRARRHRHERLVRQGRARGLLGRHQPDRRRRSTIRMSSSTRTTPAARSATTPSTATPRSRS